METEYHYLVWQCAVDSNTETILLSNASIHVPTGILQTTQLGIAYRSAQMAHSQKVPTRPV